MTELAIREDMVDGGQAVQLLLDLESAGALDEVSLTLTDPAMSYPTWEALGRFFGRIERSTNWWVGDWLIFGEAVFGEEHAQGVEATTAERYSEAERVTGLAHGTLMNVRSVCAAIARPRRRRELGFWIHAEVAKLDPPDQTYWLGQAIENGWSKQDLRQAIRDHFNPPAEDGAEPAGDLSLPEVSVGERIEQAARLVWNQGSYTSDGDARVPREAWAQLGAALGEGE